MMSPSSRSPRPHRNAHRGRWRRDRVRGWRRWRRPRSGRVDRGGRGDVETLRRRPLEDARADFDKAWTSAETRPSRFRRRSRRSADGSTGRSAHGSDLLDETDDGIPTPALSPEPCAPAADRRSFWPPSASAADTIDDGPGTSAPRPIVAYRSGPLCLQVGPELMVRRRWEFEWAPVSGPAVVRALAGFRVVKACTRQRTGSSSRSVR